VRELLRRRGSLVVSIDSPEGVDLFSAVSALRIGLAKTNEPCHRTRLEEK